MEISKKDSIKVENSYVECYCTHSTKSLPFKIAILLAIILMISFGLFVMVIVIKQVAMKWLPIFYIIWKQFDKSEEQYIFYSSKYHKIPSINDSYNCFFICLSRVISIYRSYESKYASFIRKDSFWQSKCLKYTRLSFLFNLKVSSPDLAVFNSG